MINFIKEIIIGTFGSGIKQSLPLAYPAHETDPFCITAICGKNNTGKTHVLREIAQAFDSRLHNQSERESLNIHAVLVEATGPVPNLLHLADLTAYKSKLEEIPIGKYKNDPGGRTPKFRKASVQFIARHLLYAFRESFDQNQWVNDVDYRLRFSQANLPDRWIHACDSEDPIVKRFEEAVGGKLYFGSRSSHRPIPHIQLALRYDEHRVYYQPTWSDGQKSLLSALLAIDYHNPEVLFIDEIENHFHPEYITQLAIFIKQTVPQTVLVTHHPHVLFSSLVDRLFYIELKSDPLAEMPSDQQLQKGVIPRSPKRQIKELITDFDVITAAYGLFHNQDRQLLNLAQATLDAAEMTLTSNIAAAFEPEVVEAAGGPFVDAQTRHLVEVLQRGKDLSRTFKVLDFGAGRGRTLKNLLKYPAARRHFKIDWSFWEPEPIQRERLNKWIRELNVTSVHCLCNEESIVEGEYDIAILANVLHEITPRTFATIMKSVSRALNREGNLVVLELFPLIRPEKYAVPYTREDMESILNESGWKIESGFLPIRGGLIQTYWICGYGAFEAQAVTQDSIQTKVEQVWEEEFKRYCMRYDGRREIRSLHDQIELMGALTTIASIANYKLGNWR